MSTCCSRRKEVSNLFNSSSGQFRALAVCDLQAPQAPRGPTEADRRNYRLFTKVLGETFCLVGIGGTSNPADEVSDKPSAITKC